METVTAVDVALNPPSVVEELGERVDGDTMKVLDETWVLANAGANPGGTWILDYSPDSTIERYVRPSSPLTHPALNLTEDIIDVFFNGGLYTIQDVAHADAAKVCCTPLGSLRADGPP